MRKKLLWYVTDVIIFGFSFWLLVLLKFGFFKHTDRILLTGFYTFIVWTVISIFTRKQNVTKRIRAQEIISDVAISNVFVLLALLILARLRPRFTEIRFLEIYLVLLGSFLEFIAGLLFAWYNRINKKPFLAEQENGIDLASEKETTDQPFSAPFVQTEVVPEQIRQAKERLDHILTEEADEQVINFIHKYITHGFAGISVVSTTTRFNILNLPLQDYEMIINLKRVNDINHINKFFESVNSRLKQNGIYIASVETYELRKKRVLAKYPRGINHIFYFFDFLVKRVSPKLPVSRNLYFFFTRGQNRVLSKAETYGRLYSCGFEFVDESLIQDRLYFVMRKIKEPCFDPNPTYGPVIRLKRIGMHGKIISVYKLRTMHAYSEYLQAYIYKRNHLQEGGKFRNDIRVTTIGRIFRRLWIDEFPMVINLAKGEVKIFGVRPLSQHYFDLYSDELREKRVKYKPGLIPPFYADLPKTLPEIMESEMKYLESYERNPFETDFVYFWKAVRNILFKKVRSN